MLHFITENKDKIETAKRELTPFNIEFEVMKLKITEVQFHDIEEIAVDKAQKAFKEVKKPLFVNDADWYIKVLNGFL